MNWSSEQKFGVATRDEVVGLTGRQHLQAIMDGHLPAPPIAKTMSFALIEIGEGVVAFEGTPGPHQNREDFFRREESTPKTRLATAVSF